jgi:hypothetical protein
MTPVFREIPGFENRETWGTRLEESVSKSQGRLVRGIPGFENCEAWGIRTDPHRRKVQRSFTVTTSLWGTILVS